MTISTFIARSLDPYTGGVYKELVIPLTGVGTEYRVEDIDGLGPVQNDLNVVDRGQDPGGMFLSSRAVTRTITIKLGFNPNWKLDSDVGTLRRNLYPVIGPGKLVQLSFETNFGRVLVIDGVSESLEPDIFTKDPSVVVTIVCVDPYFRADEPRVTVAIPASPSAPFIVDYEGTVPVSFEFRMTASASGTTSQQVELINRSIGEMVGFRGVARQAGDLYVIDTQAGSRGIGRQRGTSWAYLNGYLVGSLSGMRLVPGDNNFSMTFATSFNNRSLSYQPLYEGV